MRDVRCLYCGTRFNGVFLENNHIVIDKCPICKKEGHILDVEVDNAEWLVTLCFSPTLSHYQFCELVELLTVGVDDEDYYFSDWTAESISIYVVHDKIDMFLSTLKKYMDDEFDWKAYNYGSFRVQVSLW